MKNFTFHLILFCFSFSVISAQEIAFEFKCEQKSKLITKKNYSLSNYLNGDLAILIREKKTLFAYLFDDKFNSKSQFSFESKKKNRFNVLLGYTIKKAEYSLVYSDNFQKKFFAITIDFENKTNRLQEIDLEFKNERYIKTISHNNNLYVLSSTSDNKLIIRLLNDNYEFEIVKEYLLELDKEQKMQLSSFSFLNFNLSTNKPSSNFTKIDNRIPNSLEKTTQNNKIFNDKSNLYLTFDNKTISTLMYKINLSDFSIERREFVYPVGKIDEYKKYNSYYVDGLLFQIASSKKEMTFVVRDLNEGLLKLFYFNKDTPINIKNTPLTQKEEVILPFDGKRNFEETSKFLRKITSGKIGLCAYKQDDGYHLTIGGVKELQGSGMTGFSSMPSTTLGVNSRGQIAPVTTYNPTYSGFSSYSTTKSTYFKTKLDFDFNYKKEEVSATIFEKIEKYKEDLKDVSTEDIFFHNNQLYFGYYNMKDGLYKLVKF